MHSQLVSHLRSEATKRRALGSTAYDGRSLQSGEEQAAQGYFDGYADALDDLAARLERQEATE